jgi:hypothetical protein
MSLSSGFKLLVPCALALNFASGCLPDLDSLSAEYSASGGTSGDSNSDGGMGNTGNTNNGGGAGAPVANACANMKKDSNESDVDCGGSSKCERCAVTYKCNSNSDCDEELYCKTGSPSRCTEPTCSDKIQNGHETGKDCGGDCPACDLGVACDQNSDCTDEYCFENVCTDHCTSDVIESDETDKDCGGSSASCPSCGDGKHCLEADDCVSLVCSNQVCKAATCSDQTKNQDESDTDCGGSCSATKPCQIGAVCDSPDDCASWICSSSGKCIADTIIVQSTDILDDFEDGNLFLPTDPALGGRIGSWYPFSDQTPTATLSYGTVTIDRGASKKGLQTKGSGFTTWGSGVGVDLAPSKGIYDASAYDRLTFWARAANALTVTVVFPDVDTAPEGHLCTTCDHHYLSAQQVGTTWQRYTISFASLNLEDGTIPKPLAFKPEALISVQFRFTPAQTYDVFIDDVAFLPKPKP